LKGFIAWKTCYIQSERCSWNRGFDKQQQPNCF